MKRSKEIKQNWTGTEKFDKCFCIILDHYWQAFISEKEARF